MLVLPLLITLLIQPDWTYYHTNTQIHQTVQQLVDTRDSVFSVETNNEGNTMISNAMM